MFLLKRIVVLAFVLGCYAGNTFAQSWVNELLVHRTPSYTEGGAEDCLICHSGEKMRGVAQGPHGDTENPLTPFGQQQCESCHGACSIHISRAHGGKGYPPLTVFGHENGAAPRDVQIEACSGCHAGEGGDIKTTQFHGTLHDKWIVNCASCHQVHVEADPVLNRRTQAGVCLNCHTEQKDEHPKVGKRIPDFDRMGCAGCHKVHRLPKPETSED